MPEVIVDEHERRSKGFCGIGFSLCRIRPGKN